MREDVAFVPAIVLFVGSVVFGLTAFVGNVPGFIPRESIDLSLLIAFVIVPTTVVWGLLVRDLWLRVIYSTAFMVGLVALPVWENWHEGRAGVVDPIGAISILFVGVSLAIFMILALKLMKKE